MSSPDQPAFRGRILIHLAGWILFWFIPVLLAPPFQMGNLWSHPSNLLSMALRNLLLMALFYFNLIYLAPKILPSRGGRVYLAIVSPIVVVVSLLLWEIHHQFAEPVWMPDNMPMPIDGEGPPMRVASSLLIGFIVAVVVTTISTTVFLWNDWVKTRGVAQQRAFEKLSSELAVLKLQISPHFLFNTLNNIRWLVRSGSDRAEEAVIKLSQILRYILYQTETEKVTLEKEVDHLRDYISLQQMRLSDEQSLIFTVSGELEGHSIAPLLLIPLVENVFKYGSFDQPFSNHIRMDVKSGRLVFTTDNRVQASMTVNKRDSGIGLSNVQKRLQLHYPGRHDLTFGMEDNVFHLRLELML